MANEEFIALPLMLVGVGVHLLFFGGGEYALYHAIRARHKAAARMNWPSVPGKIVSSQAKGVVVHDGDGMRSALLLDADHVPEGLRCGGSACSWQGCACLLQPKPVGILP